jgi:hypothetical protein
LWSGTRPERTGRIFRRKGGRMMPGGDRTGPLGEGPGTGRQMGDCSPQRVEQPGTPVPGLGRGLGRGAGLGRGMGAGRGFGRGCGRALRRGFGGGR